MADWVSASKLRKILRSKIKHYERTEVLSKKYHLQLQAKGKRIALQSMLSWIEDELMMSNWNRKQKR